MQNITLAIPKNVLLKVKMIAVQQGTSISGFLPLTLEEIVTREEGYQAARRQYLALLEDPLALGTEDAVFWIRANLPER